MSFTQSHNLIPLIRKGPVVIRFGITSAKVASTSDIVGQTCTIIDVGVDAPYHISISG
jgi:hypothetical protein